MSDFLGTSMVDEIPEIDILKETNIEVEIDNIYLNPADGDTSSTIIYKKAPENIKDTPDYLKAIDSFKD